MEERLHRFLARAGVASRRAAEALIAAGHVSVNGHVVTAMGVRVDPAEDEIRVDTEVVQAPPPPPPLAAPRDADDPAAEAPPPPSPPRGAVYVLLHKPRGVLSTARDDRGRPTVVEMVRAPGKRLYPAGR